MASRMFSGPGSQVAAGPSRTMWPSDIHPALLGAAPARVPCSPCPATPGSGLPRWPAGPEVCPTTQKPSWCAALLKPSLPLTRSACWAHRLSSPEGPLEIGWSPDTRTGLKGSLPPRGSFPAPEGQQFRLRGGAPAALPPTLGFPDPSRQRERRAPATGSKWAWPLSVQGLRGRPEAGQPGKWWASGEGATRLGSASGSWG